jgi:hypothetical protein
MARILATIALAFDKIFHGVRKRIKDREAKRHSRDAPSASTASPGQVTGEEEDGASEEDYDAFAAFRPVIAMIDFERLKNYAVRLRLDGTKPSLENQGKISSQLTCSIKDDAMCGSFNLIYVVEFSDGCRWVARFPINAPNFGTLDREKMDSEYQTMRYIRKSLRLAVPEVYAWHTDASVVGSPFALMAFVPGVRVMDRWFDPEWCTEEKRLKILTNCARYMAILQTPTYDRSGTLRFHPDGTFSHLGPDIHIILDDGSEDIENQEIKIKESAIFFSLEEWLSDDWDTLEGVDEEDLAYEKGCLEVVRLALASVPDYLRRTDRFVLDMVDYNSQNIFIDDDCNITGFIDWDGVRAVPQGIGSTRYPSWITRDWELYNYINPVTEEESWTLQEDTPEQLSKYRKHYADVFASLGLGKGYDPRETRLSHILEAINLAAGLRMNRQGTVIKLLFHAFRGKIPFRTRELFEALGNTETEAGKLMRKQVLAAFKTMWFAEWECEETRANNKLSLRDMTPLDPWKSLDISKIDTTNV